MPLPPQPPPEPPRSLEIPALHRRRLLNLTGLGKVALVIVVLGTFAVFYFIFLVEMPSSRKGASTYALTQAKQIGLSCMVYASDHAGQYPGGNAHALGKTPRDANAVFQELIDGGYLPDEVLLYNSRSNWCKAHNGDKKVDIGENSLAYFLQPKGEKAPAKRPLIASAWMPGTSAVYAKSAKVKGYGIGKNGREAIVIQVDMSGKLHKIDGGTRTIVNENTGDNALWPNPVTGFNRDAIPLLPKE